MTLANAASIPLKNEQYCNMQCAREPQNQTEKLQIIDTRKTQYESVVLQIATFESVSNLSNFLLPFVFIISFDCSLLFLLTNPNTIYIHRKESNIHTKMFGKI